MAQQEDTPNSINYPSGRIFLHGDHLGSVSVVTDNDRRVLSRQDYTPWGEVRAGGVAQTTLDFTGQRRDGTGLLYYGARYYDPQTGRFTSPDSVAPGKGNPQARNRYSYVLDNPLKFIDPTGHCYDNAQNNEERAENQRCLGYIGQIADLQGDVQGFGHWKSEELATLLASLRDWYIATGWTRSDFLRNMGNQRARFERISFAGLDGNFRPTNDPDQVRHAGACIGCDADGAIIISDNVFAGDELFARSILVHEMAHQWDFSSGQALSKGLVNTTGGRTDNAGNYFQLPGGRTTMGEYDQRASDYGTSDRKEDFAESVAATIYPNQYNRSFQGTVHNQYIGAAFYCARTLAPNYRC